MGMFDREPNFEAEFTPGDRFVMTALRPVGTVQTVHGPAKKVLVTCVTPQGTDRDDAYPKQVTYSALGVGFFAMAERAQASDFPVVVEFTKRPTAQGSVKRWERVDVTPGEFVRGDNGPPLAEPETGADPQTGAPSTLGF